MTEIQFNAVKKAEDAAAKLAKRFGLKRPVFLNPHSDPEISMTRALIAEANFLNEMAGELAVVTTVTTAVEVAAAAPTVPVKKNKKA